MRVTYWFGYTMDCFDEASHVELLPVVPSRIRYRLWIRSQRTLPSFRNARDRRSSAKRAFGLVTIRARA